MLWTLMTPKASSTPWLSSSAATTSPTVAEGVLRMSRVAFQVPKRFAAAPGAAGAPSMAEIAAAAASTLVLETAAQELFVERDIDRDRIDRGDRPAALVAHRRRHRGHAALEEGGADRIAALAVFGEERLERGERRSACAR